MNPIREGLPRDGGIHSPPRSMQFTLEKHPRRHRLARASQGYRTFIAPSSAHARSVRVPGRLRTLRPLRRARDPRDPSDYRCPIRCRGRSFSQRERSSCVAEVPTAPTRPNETALIHQQYRRASQTPGLDTSDQRSRPDLSDIEGKMLLWIHCPGGVCEACVRRVGGVTWGRSLLPLQKTVQFTPAST